MRNKFVVLSAIYLFGSCSVKTSDDSSVAPQSPNDHSVELTAPGSAIKLGSPVKTGGAPVATGGLKAPYTHLLKQEYALNLEHDANVSVSDFNSGSACNSGVASAGPFLTLMSGDTMKRSSDSVAYDKGAVGPGGSITASLTKGAHKVIVTFYSTGNCYTAGANFTLTEIKKEEVSPIPPAPTPAPTPSGPYTESVEELLKGQWQYIYGGQLAYRYSFQSTGKRLVALRPAGGAVIFDVDLKVEFDTAASPKRLRQTITKVNEVMNGVTVQVGETKNCIYKVDNSQFRLECNDADDASFPAAFTGQAMTFRHTP